MAILLAGVLAVYIILELCKKVDARDRAMYSAATAQKKPVQQTTSRKQTPQFIVYSKQGVRKYPDSVA